MRWVNHTSVGLAILASGLALAVGTVRGLPLAEPEVARLVRQLGSDDFDKREAATARLKEIGKPALDAVTKAATSSDPEVRRRAEDIVAAIEDKLYPELLLIGHAREVWCVCVSADGKRLLTGSGDTTLRLWDADTGKCLRVFDGHTGPVWGAALSLGGKRVLSGGGDDGTVRLWDAATAKELRNMTGHIGNVSRVAFSLEGQAISGGADKTMQRWDLNTGKNAGVFTGHTGPVYPAVYSDQAKLAATGSHDQSIRLWNLETGKEISKIPSRKRGGHIDMDICFSPDGKRLRLVRVDMSVRILDVATGKELIQIKAAHASCAAFSPGGKRIVSGGDLDHNVRARTQRPARSCASMTATPPA